MTLTFESDLDRWS